MPAPPYLLRVAALAALTTACAATAYRLHRLRRALDAERAARRLTGRLQHRDLEAFTTRITAAVHAHRAVTEADLVLSEALAAHHDPEGGTP